MYDLLFVLNLFVVFFFADKREYLVNRDVFVVLEV
jgi:hypothetical protein